MKVYLAIDLGGTNTSVGLVRGGKFLAQTAFSTLAEQGPEDWTQRLARACGELRERVGDPGLTVAGAGLGTPGALDRDQGVVLISPNLPRFSRFPLRERVGRALDVPLALENDANLYALGEFRHGLGGGRRDLACFTLGTGVGGGVVLGGHLQTGPLGTGGELGHTIVEPGGRLCGCGARGCLEAYASATGLRGMLAEALAEGVDTVLDESAGVREMDRAANGGDGLALAIFERAGRALGRAVNNLVCTLGVDLYVMGGGVSRGWPLMAKAARRELESLLYLGDPSLVEMKPTELGDAASLLGAAALAEMELN